jgi:hypothetical protein
MFEALEKKREYIEFVDFYSIRTIIKKINYISLNQHIINFNEHKNTIYQFLNTVESLKNGTYDNWDDESNSDVYKSMFAEINQSFICLLNIYNMCNAIIKNIEIKCMLHGIYEIGLQEDINLLIEFIFKNKIKSFTEFINFKVYYKYKEEYI